MKKMHTLLFLLFMAGSLIYAIGPKGQCAMSSSECPKSSQQCEKSDESPCPIAKTFFKKAHFLLDSQKEIGLSEEQINQIKALKLEVKKRMIRQAAEMQVFALEIEAKMHQPVVDVEGLNAMIDQAFTGSAQGAKAGIADYAALKALITEEQMAKAKEIWMNQPKSEK